MQDDQTSAALTALNRDQIAQSLRDGLMTRWRDGGDAVIGMFHSDAVAQVIGDRQTVHFSGTYRGKDEIRRMMSRIEMEFRFENYEVREVLVDGNRAVAIWRLALRSRGTGARGIVEGMTRVILENGLIVSVFEVVDTDQVARMVRGD